jgi:hypothetical protein
MKHFTLPDEVTYSPGNKPALERFALRKAKASYRNSRRPAHHVPSRLPSTTSQVSLPMEYSFVEIRNDQDVMNLKSDFDQGLNNLDGNNNFFTQHSYLTHQFTRKRRPSVSPGKPDEYYYEHEWSNDATIELGVRQAYGMMKLNHLRKTYQCRRNGRRWSRSVVRIHNRLCVLRWTNPSPPDDDTTSGSSTGPRGLGQNPRLRPCPRGTRRVQGGRCRRIRGHTLRLRPCPSGTQRVHGGRCRRTRGRQISWISKTILWHPAQKSRHRVTHNIWTFLDWPDAIQ